jgi:hypothetical protein
MHDVDGLIGGNNFATCASLEAFKASKDSFNAFDPTDGLVYPDPLFLRRAQDIPSSYEHLVQTSSYFRR